MSRKTSRFDTATSNNAVREMLTYGYRKKYWTLFVSKYRLLGFDYGVPTYILDNIYRGRSLASFKLKTPVDVDVVAFQPFSEAGFDLYNNPVGVFITPSKDYDKIPFEILVNNKDCALYRCDYSIYDIVESKIEQMVDIDMTIRTNVKLHKIPWIAKGGDKILSLLDDILNDKSVVAVDEADVDTELGAVCTGAPYLIDKLQQAKISIDTEILSIIGVKGQKQEKQAQMTTDEVNMNDEEVNGLGNRIFDKIDEWLKKTNELFGTNYSLSDNNALDDTSNNDNGLNNKPKDDNKGSEQE